MTIDSRCTFSRHGMMIAHLVAYTEVIAAMIPGCAIKELNEDMI
jgi:hypothetical protein